MGGRARPGRRVGLFHWNAGEAAERIARLRKAGFDAMHHVVGGAGSLRPLGANPPDAFAIDLGRLPSHGRDVALALRTSRATRRVPIVFVGGDPGKVSGIRKLLPDASYTDWERAGAAIARAIAHPPEDPVVPRSRLEGYSATLLPKKLGIKPGSRVALITPPAGFARTLGTLPEGAELQAGIRSPCDIALWFVTSRRDLSRRVEAMGRVPGPGGLWIVWPKKASGAESDLTQALVREAGLANGLVDYKICAIDATWSGLRFTRRKRP